MSRQLRNGDFRDGRNGKGPADTASPVRFGGLLSEELFARTLYLERKRSERSGHSFIFMALESTRLLNGKSREQAIGPVMQALAGSTRDTDIRGWYRNGCAIGVVFTELGDHDDIRAVVDALLGKVTEALSRVLNSDQMNDIRLSFRIYPQEWDQGSPTADANPEFDELFFHPAPKPLARLLKRLIDILGSLAILLCALPVLALIAVAVKLTSRGPVLFRQQRLGQYGRRFKFLKFRSMYVNNDDRIHQEFVKQFIAGKEVAERAANAAPYKLTADPRVTPLGGFLRKTSLDELPQLFNVLKGDMSLVGPRPPVPYEVQCYQAWHRVRLLAAKPGITGLWQVHGRSRVKFDDMVRMDLRYASTWSLWLDIKILLQTPRAVLTGSGAH